MRNGYKIIVNHDTNTDPAYAMRLVLNVMEGGLVSKSHGLPSYCAVTKFTTEGSGYEHVVVADRTETGNHRFRVEKQVKKQ